MKKIFLVPVLFVVFALFNSFALAGDGHNHDANVIKKTDDGKVALCACGHEVKVTDDTPSVDADGNTYYLCSEGCKVKFSENLSTIKPMLDMKVSKAKVKSGMLGNVYKVNDDGSKVAKCACGMDVAVNDDAVTRMHNGQTYYLCSDKCAVKFDEKPDMVIKAAKDKVKSVKKMKTDKM